MGNFDGVSFRKENFLQYYTSAAVGAIGSMTGFATGGGASAGMSAGLAGAGAAAGNFALTQAGNAVKNMSIIMMVLGTLQFIMRPVFGDSHPLIFVLSLVLFVMAGYALAEKVNLDKVVVFLPMLIFCIWYFYFKANYMPSFLIYFLTISAFVLIAVDVVTKGKGIQPELYGLLPVVFFFLDIGLIPFLVDTVGLPMTDLAQSLILFMPWWAFFGVMTFPIDTSDKESKINALMRIIHVLGVIYIVFVFLLPMIPTVGYDASSLIPDTGTFTATQEAYREKLSGTENPMYSTIVCLMGGEFSTLSVCVDERKLQSEFTSACKEELNDKELNEQEYQSELTSCVAQANEDKDNWENSISGSVSSDLDKHVDIQISKGDYFDDEISAIGGNMDMMRFPVDVRIENPLDKEFDLKVDCNFTNQDKKKPSVTGSVEHALLNSGKIAITESDEYTFLCVPTENLNGTYYLDFSVGFNMETHSYLKRAIVENYDEEHPTRDAYQYELLSAFFIGDGKNGEAYYADEFVAINFEIGNKVIELDDYPLLSSSVENIGDGTILSIDWYEIEIGSLEVEGSLNRCYSGSSGDVYIEAGNNKGDAFSLGSCYVTLDSDILQTVEDFDISFHTFKANVAYTYEISEKYKLEVELR